MQISPDGLKGVGETVALHLTPSEMAGEGEGFTLRESVVDHVNRLISNRRIPAR